MKSREVCTLSNEDLIIKCKKWISDLCETKGKSWVLRVPVDKNHDPDMLFCELVDRFKNKLSYGKFDGGFFFIEDVAVVRIDDIIYIKKTSTSTYQNVEIKCKGIDAILWRFETVEKRDTFFEKLMNDFTDYIN